MKNLVVYYSRKGSNEFLSKQIAGRLNCDMERIHYRVNAFSFILMNISFGMRPLKAKLSDYDRIILVGPIFMGRFITPLKSFLKRYKDQIQELVFATCCGSTDKGRDEKFGHGLVFRQLDGLMEGKLKLTMAFPIALLLPEDQQDDTDAFMKTHLTQDNFTGKMAERFEAFMKELD